MDVLKYVGMYIFMHLCVYVFMYVSRYICMYEFMYLCISVYVYVCVFVSMYEWEGRRERGGSSQQKQKPRDSMEAMLPKSLGTSDTDIQGVIVCQW